MPAYIFDMDGTLLDSMGVWAQVDIDFLSARGLLVPPDYVETICSMSFTEAAYYTIERFGLNESAEDLRREWNALAVYAYGHTVPLKPGAKEFLLKLKERGAPLAVATSLPPGLYGPALKNHGLDYIFDTVCSTEETVCGKTKPDIFLLTAERLGVSPQDCVVFEDILAAVKSAKSVGMTVCAVYDKYSDGDWEEIKKTADCVLYDFINAPLF